MVTVYTQDFSQWDDCIEWKAQMKMFSELSTKMEEVRLGHFEIA